MSFFRKLLAEAVEFGVPYSHIARIRPSKRLGASKMHHELKIKPEFWTRICNGEKQFEIRKNDRLFQKGDTVSFINSLTEAVTFAGPEAPSPLVPSSGVFEITYVLSGYGLVEGYVAFGIREIIDTHQWALGK